MEKTTKTLITVIFPGMAGFVIGWLLVLPGMLSIGMSPGITFFAGVVVTGMIAALLSALLRRRALAGDAAEAAQIDAAIPAE